MAGVVHKPERAILYLRASAGEPEQSQDSTVEVETLRGVLFLKEKILVNSDSELIDPEVTAEVEGERKPVAAEGERGRAENGSQSYRGRRGAGGRIGASGVGAGGDPAHAA